MPLQKNVLRIVILLIIGGCTQKNPYKSEEIVFMAPKKEIVNRLHRQFDFESITFSGSSLEINAKQTIDLKLTINNPKFKGREFVFAQKFAKKVKDYVINIDYFNVISVDTKVRTENLLGYTEKTNKTLFDQKSLNEISVSDYFHQSK